jgi:hypothetical protein
LEKDEKQQRKADQQAHKNTKKVLSCSPLSSLLLSCPLFSPALQVLAPFYHHKYSPYTDKLTPPPRATSTCPPHVHPLSNNASIGQGIGQSQYCTEYANEKISQAVNLTAARDAPDKNAKKGGPRSRTSSRMHSNKLI